MSRGATVAGVERAADWDAQWRVEPLDPAAAEGVGFEPMEADVFALPAELQGTFDVSMSFGLCEHFLGERRRSVVAAHLELLRPGGLAFPRLPNRPAPPYPLWMATMKRRRTWPLGTEEPFSAAELER